MTPSSLIIFGFTGDLAKRKLMPSLYNLEVAGKLDDHFRIIGVSRRSVEMEEFKDQLDASVKAATGSCDRKIVDKLCERISIADADISNAEDYSKLRKQIEDSLPPKCEAKLFYFAIPPDLFEAVIKNLVKADIHKCGNNVSSRLLIEKPFGHSLESAKQLLATIEPHFGTESVYPIDHYMAKDTVQNILYFRLHNPLVRTLWDNANIKCIQVTALEAIDIQGRVNFYEQTGALRDMLQGHLLQVLALATMDEPENMSTEAVRNNRQKLLKSIKPIAVEDVSTIAARGQYKGYKDEVGNPKSKVETFAALKLEIDSLRWGGVPIFLRAGKAMSTKLTEINVVFASTDHQHTENILTFRLQPNEGIAISLATKKPGLDEGTQNITLDYCYHNEKQQLVDAYDRIVYDAIRGDQTLFPSDAEIINNWTLVQPVLDAWSKSDQDLTVYDKGSTSVDSSVDLIARNDAEWVHHESWVCSHHNHKENQ